MKAGKKIASIALTTVFALTTAFAGGTSDKSTKPAASATGAPAKVKTIYAAHTQTNVPYDIVNEKGESDGFEVAVLKAIDELLPQYEFKFVPTTDEDLLIGLDSGKYDIATKGAWSTAERRTKYLFPNKPIAASVIGITFRTADADKIKDLGSFAAYSGKLVPISPQSAQYSIIEDYNKAHADKPIKLVPSDVFIINDAYSWVLEGRYDAFFDLELSFAKNVTSEKGPYHSLAGKLTYVPYKGVPTWPLFNKNDQELVDAYNKAYDQLEANGTLSKLSQKYLGKDVFLLLK
jgi:L-cystine transport system substrate-binding protein